jgi:hypothetical protein
MIRLFNIRVVEEWEEERGRKGGREVTSLSDETNVVSSVELPQETKNRLAVSPHKIWRGRANKNGAEGNSE